MSKYTVRGSATLDARIDADLARITEVAAPHAIAGILLGGYGRGEGTPFIHSEGSQSPFNDYDLVVVVEHLNRAEREKFRQLEKQLSDELRLPVDLYPYRKKALRRCEFSLLNYEMKHGHKVVWGDDTILEAMPDYPHDAIPMHEGARLLLNRGKLLLDIKQRLARPEPLNEEERIRFIKFIHKALLAFGDCALLAAGKYDISYTVKKSRIQRVGGIPECDFIIAGYLAAIELKEWGDYARLKDYDIVTEFKKTQSVFLHFMPWYRTQYAKAECPAWKALALNLKWNRALAIAHPRVQLYDDLMELLRDNTAYPTARFYTLQQRFS